MNIAPDGAGADVVGAVGAGLGAGAGAGFGAGAAGFGAGVLFCVVWFEDEDDWVLLILFCCF
jgi:hypothetical protein